MTTLMSISARQPYERAIDFIYREIDPRNRNIAAHHSFARAYTTVDSAYNVQQMEDALAVYLSIVMSVVMTEEHR